MFHARLLHVVFGALAGEAHVFRDFTGSSARTGILRDVSFCCGSRYSTSFASLSRSLPLSVRARTFSFSGPTSIVAVGFASRLTYHAGSVAAPLADVITTKMSRSEERREGKSVDLGGRRIIKKKNCDL